MELKKTPLYAMHQKYKGKLIDFGGWELPVQYEGIIKEHKMVREKAGLFDVSHMGEIEVKGKAAQEYVQYLTTNNIKKLAENQVMYALMCYPHGGVVDDLIIYKYSEEHYFLVVNASNTDKDFAWIKENCPPDVMVTNVSEQYAQLAIQGPKAQEILQKISDTDLNTIKFFYFNPEVKIAGVPCIVSRTGYTGEDGFEVYLKPGQAGFIWEEIIKAGGQDIAPIGLGARDSLRFEAKLPLYGQEINQDITPLEAKLGFFVKLDNDDFIGRKALLKQKEDQPARTLVEFYMLGRGIPRSHYDVEKDGQKIGWVTSGGYSPTLDKNIGLALIAQPYGNVGETIDIVIRDKPVPAQIDQGIFYKKKSQARTTP
ncbi:Aminomethyltransferase/Dimethylsulfonioproprionate demethylase DmdA [Syntrophomonas zehnderi OL-4]|uniref:Aminomethyltransferase n=1 Tax=Syntrophomonas zehnderi OL-4 TaxID=690567 RepID=A0A0E4G9N0_9FIRM|nr:glycine cleavage system aminomethyltransferase GcvT [Syntrophomonas zehnderi]CFX18527.1 Aminomethyltransferase/Dimethylsulfonioproprionate demethylase DmdA [Syntrophomonas zehnderi OL-4]